MHAPHYCPSEHKHCEVKSLGGVATRPRKWERVDKGVLDSDGVPLRGEKG